jgi:chloramphenicol-sensitive protein RarD
MQFALGVFWFDEPMPASRVAGFALIWVALAILSVDGLGERRRRTLRTAAVEPV